MQEKTSDGRFSYVNNALSMGRFTTGASAHSLAAPPPSLPYGIRANARLTQKLLSNQNSSCAHMMVPPVASIGSVTMMTSSGENRVGSLFR